jgi:hypothetical protein
MQIVNGYVCQTSCDVSAARRGHDPKNPHDDPVKAAQLAEQKALAGGRVTTEAASATQGAADGFAVEAVTFGGRLEGLSAARSGSSGVAQLLDRVA